MMQPHRFLREEDDVAKKVIEENSQLLSLIQ